MFAAGVTRPGLAALDIHAPANFPWQHRCSRRQQQKRGKAVNSINPARGLFAAALLLCAGVAQAGVNSWTLSGPEGGWAYQAAFHPMNSQIAVLSTVRGLYRTTDGSAHWTLVNDGANGPDVAFDPTNGNRVLHAANTLWLSMDAGQTFSPAQSPTDYVSQVEFATSGTVYVGAQNSQVYRSTDHANTWTPCGSLPASSKYLNTLTVDPNATNAQDHLFVSVSDGFGTADWTYRSVDGCATWLPVTSGDPSAPNKQVYRFAVKPGNPNRVLAATLSGISLSTDGGANWSAPSPTYASWVEFDPHNAGHVIALGLGSGAQLSTDDGDHWNALYGASVQNPGTAASFAFDTVNAGRILMATYIGPFLSSDGGLTFSPRNSGLHASYLQDISAADDGTVYATFSPGVSGVFRRDPSTLAWSAVNNAGLALAVGNSLFYTSHVATAPTNSSLIYAGAWLYKLARSNDGGANWQAAHPTFANNSISTFDTVVDPDSALVAYSATDHGVWKTIDGGTTWVQANTGLPAESRFVVAAPGSDVVYVIADDPASPNVNAVYKSSNAGASWSATGTLPNATINNSASISIDPSNTNVVYVASGNGLAKSSNGGASWTVVFYSGLPGGFGGGQSLLIDPVYSSTITQVGYPGFVARSIDGGANWEPISTDQPTPTRSLNRGVLDPLRPSVIIGGLIGATSAEYEVANDLSLTVTGLSASLATSSSFSASLTVRNLGPHGASPSELDVTVPGWLTPTVPGTCTRHLQTLSCQVPALKLHETYTLTLPLAVAAAGGTGQFGAGLTTHEADTDPSNNGFTLAITGSEQADLSLTLTPSAAAIDRDGPLTVTAVVGNAGPSPSSATTLSLQIPAGLTINSQTSTRGSCTKTATAVDCTLGALNVGTSATVTLTATGSTPGLQTVSGHADGAGTDSGADQDATTSISVRPVGDASVELAESADPVRVGTSFTYTATVHNLSGDGSAVHLVIPVTGAKVKAATPTAGNCTTAAAQVDCNVTFLAAGASATVTVDLDAVSAGIAAANATVTYAGTDTSSTNDTANIGTTLRLEGDLAVSIAESVDPATAGVSFDYTVTVLNNGPNDGGVHLSVPVTGATVASATMASATCTHGAGVVTCDLASLAKGASATLTISVSSATAGSASATATATFSGTDLVSTNDSATANTTVNSPPAPARGGGSSGGGGGGGSFDWLWLILLGALGARRLGTGKTA
jgi:Domain of unknown function DUF11